MNKFFPFLMVIVTVVVIGLGGMVVLRGMKDGSLFKINKNQAAVVQEIKELKRLETSSFTIEKIIDARTQGNVFQELLYGDKILLIAHGQVVAGIDLGKLEQNQISVKGKSVAVKLPQPEIFFTRLDNNLTKVYDRQQGLLSKGQKDLETEARKSAETSITEAACQSGILDQANDNAKKQITGFLHSLGFTDINVEVSQATCQ
jgi:hypothetical protein